MKKIVPLLALLSVCITAPVMAQSTSFQADNFEPRAAQRENILNVDTTDVRPHKMPSVGIFLNYANDSVQAVDAGTNRVITKPMRRRLAGDIGLAFGLGDRLELALTLPVVLNQAGNLDLYNGGGELSSSAVGDMRFVPKVRIFGRQDGEAGLGLAAAATVYLPTGDVNSFNGDGTFRVEPRLVLDYATEEGLKLAANLAYQVRPRRVALSHVSDDMVRYSLGALVPLADKLALEATGFGNVGLDDAPTGTPFEVVAGLRWLPNEAAIVQIGAGTGFNSGIGSPNFRVYTSLTWAPQVQKDEPATPSCVECSCDECDEPKVSEKDPTPRVVITKTHVVVSEKVHFDTNKAVIKPVSYSLLMEVAEALKANPQITRIRVEGHTDSRASDAHNQKLSERRAKSVVRFLTRRGGLDKSRLEAVGYGEAQPIRTNDTKEGRALNRRVEFRIVEIGGEAVAPTDKIVTETESTVTTMEEK